MCWGWRWRWGSASAWAIGSAAREKCEYLGRKGKTRTWERMKNEMELGYEAEEEGKEAGDG